jgi:hypothetical protein
MSSIGKAVLAGTIPSVVNTAIAIVATPGAGTVPCVGIVQLRIYCQS